ncbi:hypothetical protein VCHA53O466_140144 [Vibrio chagasii]|nr:hypothetical protein VCHA53O466_140144 [Vibrio chagasii]
MCIQIQRGFYTVKKINFKKKHGFTLIEFMLGSAITVSAVAAYYKSQELNVKLELGQTLGADLAHIAQAIDRRVLLDGYEKSKSWSVEVEGGDNAVIALREGLIATGSDCGVGVGKWSPANNANASVALINCDFWGRRPDNAMLSVHVKSNASQIESFQLDLFHNSPSNYVDAIRTFEIASRYANMHSSLQMTGRYEYYLVDRATSERMTGAECLGESTCGLRLKVVFPEFSESSERYLAFDGSNAMTNSLFFYTYSGEPSCYNANGEPVLCGFSYDAVSEVVDMNLSAISLQELNLVHQVRGVDGSVTSVPLECNRMDGGTEFCGISTVRSDNVNELMLNQVSLNDSLMIGFNDEGEPRFYVDQERALAERLTVAGNLNVGELSVTEDLILTGNLHLDQLKATGKLTSDSKIQTVNALFDSTDLEDGIPEVGGSDCDERGIGVAGDGTIVSCSGNTWVEPELPKNTIIYSRGSCPDGFSSLSPDATGAVAIAQYGFEYQEGRSAGGAAVTNRNAGINAVVGSNTFFFKEGDLPTHTHNFRWYTQDGKAWKGSGRYNYSGGSDANQKTTSTGGSSALDITAPGRKLNMCKKD